MQQNRYFCQHIYFGLTKTLFSDIPVKELEFYMNNILKELQVFE